MFKVDDVPPSIDPDFRGDFLLPPKNLQRHPEAQNPPNRQHRQLQPDGVERLAVVHDRAQGVIERGKRQSADYGNGKRREPFVGKERTAQDIHGHHDEVHPPARRLNGLGA